MKKAFTAILVTALMFSVALAGCDYFTSGSGKLETRQYDFKDFTRINISSAFEFDIVPSSSFNITITADDNLFKNIQVTQEGETLKIGLTAVSLLSSATLKAEIRMPQLRDIEISGASRGTISGFSSDRKLGIEASGASSLELLGIVAGDVIIEVSGASKVTGDLAAGNVNFDLSGASTLQLEGSAGDITIDASGASHVKLAGFPVHDADVTLSGASIGTVYPSGRLDADLSGASSLEYSGEPTLGTMDITGASSIKKR